MTRKCELNVDRDYNTEPYLKTNRVIYRGESNLTETFRFYFISKMLNKIIIIVTIFSTSAPGNILMINFSHHDTQHNDSIALLSIVTISITMNNNESFLISQSDCFW
jgi:hypothetical protein